MNGVIRLFGTNAWIMALTPYPRMKAQADFQKKPSEVTAASP
jgi:hypothetical protein